MLANTIHITTIGHVIKDTKLPILAKYSIIQALKCQKNYEEQDLNSKSYLKVTIPLMLEHSSMLTFDKLLQLLIQSQSVRLNFGKIARTRYEIWGLSDCNGTRTHNHIVCKQILNHLAIISGCGLKPRYSHLRVSSWQMQAFIIISDYLLLHNEIFSLIIWINQFGINYWKLLVIRRKN